MATAHAAIGLGRAEAARRRVAIGDLVGDVPPLVALVADDDPHGLVDSFLYGISLSKVAHPVAGHENLFVMPTGTEPVLTEDIFRSDRWRRLASGFREVGALLLLVAPAEAPGLESLVEMLDGVVTVGDEGGAIGGRFPVLAAVDGWGAAPEVEPADGAQDRRGSRRSARVAPVPGSGQAFTAAPAPRRWLLPLILLVVLAALAGAAWWARDRGMFAGGAAGPADRPARDTAPAASSAPPADTLPVLVVVNPGDSAGATDYAIEVAKFNTAEGARIAFEQASRLPAATWFPLRLSNDAGTWFRVIGGGWSTREAADSALAGLRASGAVEPSASLLRAPLALLVGSVLAPDSLRARITRYQEYGVPVYALRQADGTHNLYAGAFETPDQSTLLALSLKQIGDVPTLVYRTGGAP
jgi:hypothetical protein